MAPTPDEPVDRQQQAAGARQARQRLRAATREDRKRAVKPRRDLGELCAEIAIRRVTILKADEQKVTQPLCACLFTTPAPETIDRERVWSVALARDQVRRCRRSPWRRWLRRHFHFARNRIGDMLDGGFDRRVALLWMFRFGVFGRVAGSRLVPLSDVCLSGFDFSFCASHPSPPDGEDRNPASECVHRHSAARQQSTPPVLPPYAPHLAPSSTTASSKRSKLGRNLPFDPMPCRVRRAFYRRLSSEYHDCDACAPAIGMASYGADHRLHGDDHGVTKILAGRAHRQADGSDDHLGRAMGISSRSRARCPRAI